MKDQSRTKQVRIQELVTLRKRIAELERLESDRTLTETEQQPVEGLGGNSFTSSKIRVSGINVAWNSEQVTCTFEDLPVAMMWVDTTLAGLMSGVRAMVGTERFFLALQSEGRKSSETKLQAIFNTVGTGILIRDMMRSGREIMLSFPCPIPGKGYGKLISNAFLSLFIPRRSWGEAGPD